MTPDRIRAKASSATAAWRQLHGGALPSVGELVTSMAPAMHETVLGDAGGVWTGEDNWGATTERTLSKDEQSTLDAAGVKPAPYGSSGKAINESVNAARYALKRRGKRWKGLHWDSRPVQGGNVSYFTFFFVPADDVAGAAYYLRALLRGGAPDAVSNGDLDALAAAMYANRYYTGFHQDPESNIADYAKALHAVAPTIAAALSGFDPANPGPVAQRVPIPEPTPVPLGGAAAEDSSEPPQSSPPSLVPPSPGTASCSASSAGDASPATATEGPDVDELLEEHAEQQEKDIDNASGEGADRA